MAGTHHGGLKSQATQVAKIGFDAAHQRRVEQGRKGGKAPYTGKKGFAAHPELASEAGVKGMQARVANRAKANESR